MTSLLGAKKRAEEFAAVVDGGADVSTLRPELRELVGVVGTLEREAQVGGQVVPRSEFTTTLREQLMAEAATSLSSDDILKLPPRKKGTRERRIALAASSFVLVGGTAGMAAAAQNALPGEALYPIKRGLEKAQTGLATSRADQGEDLLAQADNRLVEVKGLFDSSGNLSQVPGTIDDFTRQAVEASDVLIKEYQSTRDESLIVELHQFASDNLDELQELSKTAAPEHQDELAAAAGTLMAIDSRARQVCSSCADELSTLEMPILFLAANEARVGIDAARRVVVDNSHPSYTGEVPSEPRRDSTDEAPADEGRNDTEVPTTGTDGTESTEDPDGTGTGGTTGTPVTGGDTDLTETPELGISGEGLGNVLGGGKDAGTKGGGKDSGKDGGKDSQDHGIIPEELQDAVETLLP
jgi:hypothetical protein